MPTPVVVPARTPAPAPPSAAGTARPAGGVEAPDHPILGAAPAAPAAAPTRAPRPESAVPPTPPKAKASVSVGYVLVPFVVTDRKGRPVRDLAAKDVTLLCDGEPVAIDFVERSDDAPVSFTILLDGSGSMGLVGKIDGARMAIRALLANRQPHDDYALYVFAEGEVREVVPFTEDPSRVVAAVDRVKPWGKTAFYDALAAMPERSLLGKNGARAIILLTDGLDNASTLTRDELTKLLEGIEVPVYPLGLRSPGLPATPVSGAGSEKLVNIDVLDHVARISGGRLSVVDDPSELPAAVLGIEKDLRAQYLIGFAPTGKGPVKYRSLTLKLAGPARPVRVRAGYRGTEPPGRGSSRPDGKGRRKESS